MSSSSTRPITSKARGTCRYYNTPRGCFASDRCKFLHGEQPAEWKPDDPPLLTPYDKSKKCRYYAEGFCKRGEACWFLHTTDSKDKQPAASSIEEEEDEPCSICFEAPTTYGLLGGCSHIFCISCIKQWRDPQSKPIGVLDSGNIKKCPMCRTPSKFIIPSSKFWKDGTQGKEKVTRAYKESMARVPCRYFQKSLQKDKNNPICPYGKDCFYHHKLADGTTFNFVDGVDECMRKYRNSQSRSRSFTDIHFVPIGYDMGASRIGINFTNPFLSLAARDDFESGGGSYAARRLREVGRSLEVLNNAIAEGATLENLNVAVETLRDGLGRQTAADVRANTNDADGIGEDDEAIVMERLGMLADQMLASINAIHSTGENNDSRDGAETPPPPLEPIGPLPPVRQLRRRDSDEESASSMPRLQSVSNTSESSFGESDSESDNDGASDEEFALNFVRNMVGALSAATLYDDEEEAGPSSRPRASTRFSTVVDRPSMAAGDDDDDDDIPELEPIADLSSAEPEALPEGENKNAVRPPDAFTTDGRGRVISVGGEAESSTSASADESGSSSGSGGGRSILGWINALF